MIDMRERAEDEMIMYAKLHNDKKKLSLIETWKFYRIKHKFSVL